MISKDETLSYLYSHLGIRKILVLVYWMLFNKRRLEIFEYLLTTHQLPITAFIKARKYRG